MRATICVVSSTLALLALSANGTSAENIVTPKVVTPKVSVHPAKPKVIQPTINWGDGTAEGAASRNKDSTLNPQPLPPVHDPGGGESQSGTRKIR
jgi:hypothetical protein